jgi:hypothetical protein
MIAPNLIVTETPTSLKSKRALLQAAIKPGESRPEKAPLSRGRSRSCYRHPQPDRCLPKFSFAPLDARGPI